VSYWQVGKQNLYIAIYKMPYLCFQGPISMILCVSILRTVVYGLLVNYLSKNRIF